MRYQFMPWAELGWAVAIAAGLVVLQALVTFDPEAITSWATWGVAVGGASIRAAAGAAIDWIRRGMTDQPSEEPMQPPALSNEDLLMLRDEMARLKRVRALRDAQRESSVSQLPERDPRWASREHRQ